MNYLRKNDFYRIFIGSMKIKQTALVAILVAASLTLIVAPVALADCGGVKTSIINCTDSSGVWGILKVAINILTAGVGVLAVGGIVYGSVLYTSSGGSLEQVRKAKGILLNTVIGIAAYALMFSFLNYLIPGGLFQ